MQSLNRVWRRDPDSFLTSLTLAIGVLVATGLACAPRRPGLSGKLNQRLAVVPLLLRALVRRLLQMWRVSEMRVTFMRAWLLFAVVSM